MAETERRFQEAEVEAILRRVFSRPGRAEGLSEAELVDTALQLGVAPETLRDAIDDHDVEAAVEATRRAWIAERQRERALTLQATSGMLLVMLGLNLALTPAVLWSLGWAVLALGVWALQGYVARQGPEVALLEEVRAWERTKVEAARRARAEQAVVAQRREVDDALGAAGQALSQTLKLRATALLEGLNARLRPAVRSEVRGVSEAGMDAGAEVAPGARARVRIEAAGVEGARVEGAAVEAGVEAARVEAEVEAELEALRHRVARR